jgi:hypothetical protein
MWERVQEIFWSIVYFWTGWHILDRMFPTSVSFFLDGRSNMTPEIARTRECWQRIMIEPPGPDYPEGRFQMCTATRCASWRFLNSPVSWKRAFTRRRGRCATSHHYY